MTGERILIVDDDRSLVKALTIGLRAENYEVHSAVTGTDGVTQVSILQPDLVILDLSLPDIDGVEVCTRIRGFSSIPIIVLSALGSAERKVDALDQGADDYVTKPFGMAELLARLRVLLRRTQSPVANVASKFSVGALDIDQVHKMATLEGTPLTLTSKEFDLLAFLARHAGKVCTQQMILREVWGRAYNSESHYVRAYAHRLRRKLGDQESMLITHPGIGYELVGEPRHP